MAAIEWSENPLRICQSQRAADRWPKPNFQRLRGLLIYLIAYLNTKWPYLEYFLLIIFLKKNAQSDSCNYHRDFGTTGIPASFISLPHVLGCGMKDPGNEVAEIHDRSDKWHFFSSL